MQPTSLALVYLLAVDISSVEILETIILQLA